MKRVPWAVLFALLLGVGIGLGYAWVISPHRMMAAKPNALRADFKDQYRSLVAAAYAATGNLPRARARLSVLGDVNPIEALNAQAQRMMARAQTFESAEHVAALASALGREASGAPLSTLTLEVPIHAGETFTPSASAPLTEVSTLLPETPGPVEVGTILPGTQPIAAEDTPRATQTSTPLPGEPFRLTGQETICDSNLPAGLLQVSVLNRSRRQLAGVEIVIAWDGGREQFFTGLKPELGNGYADYIMAEDTHYTVQLGRGSDVARGVRAPTCQNPDGTAFLGGIKLTFQQP